MTQPPAATVANPDPVSSTSDKYKNDRQWTNCSDPSQPGIAPIVDYLASFDEGGGYWDSGFMQPIDFFGDGPRIPFIVVSPYSRGGKVAHTYTDHASVLKFIERNWHLQPLTSRSRDNLPNPVPSATNPYVPANMPAIGDLFDMFDFGS